MQSRIYKSVILGLFVGLLACNKKTVTIVPRDPDPVPRDTIPVPKGPLPLGNFTFQGNLKTTHDYIASGVGVVQDITYGNTSVPVIIGADSLLITWLSYPHVFGQYPNGLTFGFSQYRRVSRFIFVLPDSLYITTTVSPNAGTLDNWKYEFAGKK